MAQTISLWQLVGPASERTTYLAVFSPYFTPMAQTVSSIASFAVT